MINRCSIPGPLSAYIIGTIDLYQRYSNRELKQTNDLHPVPRLRIRAAILPRLTRLHCMLLQPTVFPSTNMNRIKPCCLRKIHRTFHFTVIKVHSHLRNEETHAGLSAIRTQKANSNTSVRYNILQILTFKARNLSNSTYLFRSYLTGNTMPLQTKKNQTNKQNKTKTKKQKKKPIR
jgi:hypothetical protein